MLKIFITCLLWLFAFKSLDAQTVDTIKGTYNIKEHSLPFCLIKIGQKIKTNIKTPVLLFLHGAGEQGNNNITQLQVGLPILIKSILETTKDPCYIIVPQCPENEKWVNTDWTKTSHIMETKINWSLNGALQILDSIIKSNNAIDTNRIYLTGLSMGGFGVWDILQRFPNKFAAAIPICGGGDTSLVEVIKKTPIWAFHGRKDKLVKVTRTIDMVTAINKKGGKAKITILEKQGHLCWNAVYENKTLITWLFSNKRNAK